MQLVVESSGNIRCIYGEQIELALMGKMQIVRVSHVEPDGQGNWWADLSPVNGPNLGPFARRSHALEAEIKWIERYWLSSDPIGPSVSATDLSEDHEDNHD